MKKIDVMDFEMDVAADGTSRPPTPREKMAMDKLFATRNAHVKIHIEVTYR